MFQSGLLAFPDGAETAAAAGAHTARACNAGIVARRSPALAGKPPEAPVRSLDGREDMLTRRCARMSPGSALRYAPPFSIRLLPNCRNVFSHHLLKSVKTLLVGREKFVGEFLLLAVT